MFDSELLKEILKHYGPAGLIVIFIGVLSHSGWINLDTLNTAVTTGTFISLIFIVVVLIMAYGFTLTRMLNTLKTGIGGDFSKDLVELKHQSVEILDNINNTTSENSQIHKLIMGIYEIIKGIPNKTLILDSMIIRTKYLITSITEQILDYTVDRNIDDNIEKATRKQESLSRQLTKIRKEYTESIIKISRDSFKNDYKAELEEHLNEFFSNIYDIAINPNNKIESIIFKTINEIKDLEDKFKDFFKIVINYNDSCSSED